TSDGANITEDVYNFPLLVRLDASVNSTLSTEAKTKVSALFESSMVDGSDLRFADSNGKPLRYEIESWNKEQKIAATWVALDTIRGNTKSQFIYIYTGKSDAHALSNGPAVFDTSLGYKGNWHLASATEMNDASYTANHGTGAFMNADNTVNGLIDGAVSFNGENQYVVTSQQFTNPQVFSLSLWFKTNVGGGKLIGFEDSVEGDSQDFDRHIYMGDSGRLYFGVFPLAPESITPEDTAFLNYGDNPSDSSFPGIRRIVKSTEAYNDGAWHQVVSVLSPAGQYLYVDGKEVDANTKSTSAEISNGYWRFGTGHLHSWNWGPTNPFFTGAIDEARVMHLAVTAGWIKMNYETQKQGSTVLNVE
ncbi:MAG: DUF2341 domain-containing protein, partial [Fibrobacteria bacterium]|nr:DUF2341 domain-containing protein [Fibrobacteria bacterium]